MRVYEKVRVYIDEKGYTLKMIFGDEIKELANKSAFTLLKRFFVCVIMASSKLKDANKFRGIKFKY